MKTIMASKELIIGSDLPGTGKLSFCETCAEGKAHRVPFKHELNGEVETNMDDHQDLLKDPRRSGRERNPPLYYHDEYAGITTTKYAALHVAKIEELETLNDALDSEYETQWKTVADAEYQSLLENET